MNYEKKRQWNPETNSYNVPSERLIEALAAAHDNQVVKDGNHGSTNPRTQYIADLEKALSQARARALKAEAAIKVLTKDLETAEGRAAKYKAIAGLCE